MIKRLNILVWVALLGMVCAPTAFASSDEGEFDAVHHTADGYYLDFQPIGKIELPRLFLVRGADGALLFEVYPSTAAALRSHHYIPEGGGEHGEAAEGETHGETTHGSGSDIEALIESGKHLDAHLVPAAGHIIIDFSITRHLFFAILVSLLLMFMFIRLAQRYKNGIGRMSAPRGKAQNLAETLIIFIRDAVARPNLGDKSAKFLPYLLTIFFFILLCNLIGLVPFGATATSNLMVTLVLATFTFVHTQIYASKDHWIHVFWPPGVPAFAKPFVILPEFVGLFTKPIALAIRLFANMTAGHLVILSLVGLIFIFTNLFSRTAGFAIAPVSLAFALFVSLLEVLIAFIQAYIFTILSALFIGMAVQEHSHHDEHDHAHGDEAHGHLAAHAAEEMVHAKTAESPALTPAG